MTTNQPDEKAQATTKSYPSIKQSWGIFGIAILAMLVLAPVNLILNESAGKEVSFLVYYLLSMGGTFFIVNRIRQDKTRQTSYPFSFTTAKITLLAALGIFGIQIGIVAPITELIPMSDFIKQIFMEFAGQKGFLSFIAIVIAAPILEELIFRGIILDGLLKRYSPVKAILFSSFLFGLVHLNPWQFVAAMVIGIFSGWIYYRTKNLWLPILIHLTNNGIAFIQLHLVEPDEVMTPAVEYYGGMLNMILITVCGLIVAIGCILLLRKEFNQVQDEETTSQETPELQVQETE